MRTTGAGRAVNLGRVPAERCITPSEGGKCISRPGTGTGERIVGGPDPGIASIAGRQHGVVSRRQLLELGLGESAIETALVRAYLLVLHPGVYAVGHRSLTVHGRWMAATLAGGPGTALSHRSAGQLWGLVPRSSIEIEVTRPRKFRRRAGIRAHFATLPSDEIRTVDGIPVTSPPRTMLDLAALSTARQLERAFNELEVRGLTDALSVPDLLERHPRRRGTAALRELLASEAPGGITRRELEEAFVGLIDAHGLPRPRFNASLTLRGRFFEVDCMWRRERLVVELDGRAVHGTRQAFEADRERDRILQAEGWRVTRVTWRQVKSDAHAVANDLRRLLDGPTAAADRPPTAYPSTYG